MIHQLKGKYGFDKEYASIVLKVSFQEDYGSLSTKAIRKILPYMKEGKEYSKACACAGYNHSHTLTIEQKQARPLKEKLEILPKNSLRNPIVEKILNQMISVVNSVVGEFGKPGEVRVELARELKKSAKERKDLHNSISKAEKENTKILEKLQNEFNLQYVSRNDLVRCKLYEELRGNGCKTLYTSRYISPEKLFSKEIDIDHIIPQSLLFDDSFSNKTLEFKSCNIDKSNKTALDYVKEKYGEEGLVSYRQRIESLYRRGSKSNGETSGEGKAKGISDSKYKKLLMSEQDIPKDFIDRDLRNTQYITKKAKAMLEEVFREVTTTTGSFTKTLREDWQLVDVMKELNWIKYEALGKTYYETNRDGKKISRIKDWNKRNDHRHHAMDAIAVAFTKPSYIQYLNNLNARSNKSSSIYGIEQKELYRDERGKLRFKPPIPLDELRAEVKQHLECTLVSFKAKNKVVTKNKNKYKAGKGYKTKVELTPRGQLHRETIYGNIQQYTTKEEKIGSSFDENKINKVAKQIYREALLKRLIKFGGDPKKAFTEKNSLSKNPLYLDELHTWKVPEKVKLVKQSTVYTIREEITPSLFQNTKKEDDFTNRIKDVLDKAVRDALKRHYENVKLEVEEFNQTVTNDKSKNKVLETAFSNLDERPIWLNQKKGLCIKRVTIKGISNAQAIHDKRDKSGKSILDSDGKRIPVDFVSTGNNHHAAIYRDKDGELQACVVSFYEAVARTNQGLPIIDKTLNQHEGWKFLFTMKQNEYFVFPNQEQGFIPTEVDLLNPDNYHLISPNLFRVQKMSLSSDYWFRHHLETNVNASKELAGIAYKCISSLKNIEGIVKVRVNHIGKVVDIGEY